MLSADGDAGQSPFGGAFSFPQPFWRVVLPSHAKHRTVRSAALINEIKVIEEARDALPEDSHLRALCSLAAERLGDFLSQPTAIGQASRGKKRRGSAQESDSQIGFVTSNKKGRLAGTIRRSSISAM